jgi:tRNA modification GTPase
MDTIFALATARGRAGIAVVRLSGPHARTVVLHLSGRVPAPRVATLCTLRYDGEVLDEALVLVFLAGASFTGEDVVELHLHGGAAVVRGVLQVLSQMPGVRLAEPGEFTRRALENGRLDLAQVEGLADLIDAETEAQRRQAMRILSGAMGERVGLWRAELLTCMALLEATIDFSEEDLPDNLVSEVQAGLARVMLDLRQQLSGHGAAERLREGYEVALIGPPNIGKSTLLNALAQRDAALISPIPGTTRDIIEVRMDIAGLPVTLLDTAGIRDSTDVLERAGIDRTRDRARTADLRVFLVDGENDELPLEKQANDVIVRGKADLQPKSDGVPSISGITGQGIDMLVEIIGRTLETMSAGAGLIVHARHKHAVQRAIGHIDQATNGLARGDASEICADEVRLAMQAIESLIGKVDTDELLGHIFGRFCIGK